MLRRERRRVEQRLAAADAGVLDADAVAVRDLAVAEHEQHRDRGGGLADLLEAGRQRRARIGQAVALGAGADRGLVVEEEGGGGGDRDDVGDVHAASVPVGGGWWYTDGQ